MQHTNNYKESSIHSPYRRRTNQVCILVRPLRYEEYHNNIILSRKRSISNNFDEFHGSFHIGDVVTGSPYAIENDKIRIKVNFGNHFSAEAYVHKSQISSLLFVDEKLIRKILDLKKDYKFFVKRFDEMSKVVELSRKEYLRGEINTLSYGIEYPSRIISSRNGYVAIGDHFEGVLVKGDKKRTTNSESSMVIVARIDRIRNYVEVTIA